MGDFYQTATNWWTRTPNSDNSNNEYNVNPSGARDNNNANNSNGVAPDCKKCQRQVSPYRPKARQSCKEKSSTPLNGEKCSTIISASGCVPFGYADLIRAANECKNGVNWKDSVAGFSINRIMNCHKLLQDLESGKYELSPYTCFQVHEPKDRDIVATNIRDRVVQRALCNTYLYHAITKDFIPNNMACQIGKGTTLCRKRMRQIAQEGIRKYGKSCYVLKVDIKGYFGNTSHEVAKKAVAKRIDNAWARDYVFNLIDSFHGITGWHCGIGLGSQISQLIQLAVLDDLDHKIIKRTDFYIRYMDDMVAFGLKSQMASLLKLIKKELRALGLDCSKKKTFIAKFRTMQFLGFKYYVLGRSVRMKVLRDKENRERRKLRKQLLTLPVDSVDRGFIAWKANAKQGTDYKAVRRMNKFYAIERRKHYVSETQNKRRNQAGEYNQEIKPGERAS